MFHVTPSLVFGACLKIQYTVLGALLYHLTEKRRAACVFVEMWLKFLLYLLFIS